MLVLREVVGRIEHHPKTRTTEQWVLKQKGMSLETYHPLPDNQPTDKAAA
jgi:hypothetical protein